MLKSKRILGLTLLLACAGFAAKANAEDAYYSIPLENLTQASLPKYDEAKINWQRLQQLLPHLALEQAGQETEAYLDTQPGSILFFIRGSARAGADRGALRLLARAPEGKDIVGKLFVPNVDLTGMIAIPFKITAAQATPDAKQPFLQAKKQHYEHLATQNIPGEAWFRHQTRLAKLALPTEKQPENINRNRWQRDGSSTLEDTYNLFTGARAMSENLQLDRALPVAAADETPVKIDSLEGITVAEIDWAPLIKDAKPKLDPLASKIPFDQHANFFPTFQAALAVADEANKHDVPVLRMARPRSEAIGVVQRYEQQLGLSTSGLARLLGPAVVKSVAMTGSDLYFPMGTDVAVLFESSQAAALETLLFGKIALAAKDNPQAKAVNGKVGDIAYKGFLSPNRDVSSYIAKLGGGDNVVVVTNSLGQLERLAATQKDPSKSLATLPEYIFFRTRYLLGDAEETGLAFLSDAAIRRWCGPQWRIADSRRTRARAVLAELQAGQVDTLVKKTVTPGPIHTDLPILGGGKITLEPTGVFSSTYGSLAFSTPISEMPFTEVTKAEANAYKNWRDNYQRNWRWGFDPIALRITISPQKLATDMTVMPLIFNTDYREMIRLSQGATLDPTAGNPHNALAQAILAINRDSDLFKRSEGFAGMMAPDLKNPFAWISNYVSVYADDDPFWKDLAAAKAKGDKDEDADDWEDFMKKNVSRLPVALQAGVANPLQLAAFLTAARVFIEQAAPGMARWESRKHREHPYTCIVATDPNMTPNNMTICYTVIDKALTITLSEKLLQRVIDRGLDRQEGKPIEAAKPWIGSNVAVRVDRQALEMANILSRSEYEVAMQRSCWNNLPILNEWRRLYPDRDPVAVHEQLWNSLLRCPGGGKYVWNDKYQTMESTVYGHPGEAKQGPAAPPVLSEFSNADFGVTFEHNGLRARVELRRDASK